ncbi:hypothetical protein QTP86_003586, partial [Hemibagrus guttatus]
GLLGEMQLNVPLCKSGFSQSLYSLRLSRDLVHGRSVLKGKREMEIREDTGRYGTDVSSLKLVFFTLISSSVARQNWV